jgi:hypothetical protein
MSVNREAALLKHYGSAKSLAKTPFAAHLKVKYPVYPLASPFGTYLPIIHPGYILTGSFGQLPLRPTDCG